MRSTVSVICLLAGSMTNFAFGSPVTEDHTTQSPIIDGAVTPDLVPDQVAERMVLLTLGLPKKASPEDLARQAAYVRDIGLSDEDSVVLIAEVNEFNRGYRQLLAEYNRHVDAGVVSTSEDFVANQRNPFVVESLARIRGGMSVFGVSAFNQYVKALKSHVRTAEG